MRKRFWLAMTGAFFAVFFAGVLYGYQEGRIVGQFEAYSHINQLLSSLDPQEDPQPRGASKT